MGSFRVLEFCSLSSSAVRVPIRGFCSRFPFSLQPGASSGLRLLSSGSNNLGCGFIIRVCSDFGVTGFFGFFH